MFQLISQSDDNHLIEYPDAILKILMMILIITTTSPIFFPDHFDNNTDYTCNHPAHSDIADNLTDQSNFNDDHCDHLNDHLDDNLYQSNDHINLSAIQT